MKKIFTSIWQWFLRYKKRLIYGALALFIGQICFLNLWNFGIDSAVYAEESASKSDSFDTLVQEKMGLISFFEKALYVIIYPFIFLAWKLVDNSFVYWEVFWFDAILWKLWNIMRNFANYGLWFIFIFYIFKYLINKEEKNWPKWIIKQALIAWIWIQMTWFAMGALIDISTILTYSIWGLPLSILEDEVWNNWWSGEEQSVWNYNPYVLKRIGSIDGNDIADPDIYMATIKDNWQIWEDIISACSTFRYEKGDIKEDLILAPSMIYYKNGTECLGTRKDVCHYYGQIYRFKNLHGDIMWQSCSTEEDCKQKQIEYDGWGDEDKGLTKIKKDLSSIDKSVMEDLIKWGIVLEIWNAHVTGGIRGWAGFAENKWFNIVLDCENCWFDVDNKWIWSWNTLKMSDLIKSDQTSNSYVTVFSLLYASLLDSWRSIFAVSDDSIYVKFLRAILTLWTMVAIAIPLIAATLVFLMRIGIIWIAIVLSPIIVLLKAFKLDEKEKIKNNSFLSYFKRESLIWIIFSPAVICFAASMSLVLVRIIERVSTSEIATKPLILWWLIQVNLAWFTVWLWQLIIAFMWIAITWFLVWMAVQASKLGKMPIIKNLKNLADSALWTIPIVPFPNKNGWWEMIWANSAFGLNWKKSVIENGIQHFQDKLDIKEKTAVDELFNPNKAYRSALSNEAEVFGAGLLQQQNIWSNWQETMSINVWDSKTLTFSQLNESQKEIVLNKINSADETTRLRFKDKWDLVISGKTYKFVEGEGKNKFEEIETTN